MNISKLIKALYGLRNEEKVPIIQKFIQGLDENKKQDFIDFYKESLTLLQNCSCGDAKARLRKKDVPFVAGSYSLTHQIGSFLETGELKTPSQDIAKRKSKQKKKKKYNSRIYSKTKYRKSLNNAETEDDKIRVIETFLQKRPDQRKVIDSVYHDIEEIVVKEGVRKIKHVRNEYKSAPVADYEVHQMYMAGRVLHDLSPISITDRLQQANKSKNGKRNLFTNSERNMQKRVSKAVFRGGSPGNGHSTPLPPGYSNPRS